MSEWWGTIGKPFTEDLFTLDPLRVKEAFLSFPHRYYAYIHDIYQRSPEHVIIETFLILFVLYITFFKRDKPRREAVKLTEKEVQELCDEWEPEPLISTIQDELEDTCAKPIGILESIPGTHMKLKGIPRAVLNLATFDFLGLGARTELKETAMKTLTKYGCGSCGPRGFYGSIDTHEILEKDIAKMMGTPDSIIFSDAETTSSSVLPAFAKRGDLVVVDEGCNDAILVGITLARCQVYYYKHNDLEDLERVLIKIQQEDRKYHRKSDCQRRYVVTEGIFRNHGDLLDLPQVLNLCNKYFFRLFLDESFSFGVLGATGRGITEHYNVDIKEVAIVCASLSASVAGVGGFSTGSREVVDYQRLNSAGYVFSASAPPFTSACCSEALRIMKKEPQLFQNLNKNASLMHQSLTYALQRYADVVSDPNSPVLHYRFKPKLYEAIQDEDEQRRLCRQASDQIMENCLARGIALCATRYKTNQLKKPFPSVRVSVTATHSQQDLKHAAIIIAEETKRVATLVFSYIPSTPSTPGANTPTTPTNVSIKEAATKAKKTSTPSPSKARRRKL